MASCLPTDDQSFRWPQDSLPDLVSTWGHAGAKGRSPKSARASLGQVRRRCDAPFKENRTAFHQLARLLHTNIFLSKNTAAAQRFGPPNEASAKAAHRQCSSFLTMIHHSCILHSSLLLQTASFQRARHWFWMRRPFFI